MTWALRPHGVRTRGKKEACYHMSAPCLEASVHMAMTPVGLAVMEYASAVLQRLPLLRERAGSAHSFAATLHLPCISCRPQRQLHSLSFVTSGLCASLFSAA